MWLKFVLSFEDIDITKQRIYLITEFQKDLLVVIFLLSLQLSFGIRSSIVLFVPEYVKDIKHRWENVTVKNRQLKVLKNIR